MQPRVGAERATRCAHDAAFSVLACPWSIVTGLEHRGGFPVFDFIWPQRDARSRVAGKTAARTASDELTSQACVQELQRRLDVSAMGNGIGVRPS
jgi:hypothetical protein